MNRPLIVYLDSSDISNLSNPKTRTIELVDLESSLLTLQQKGLIEFRFSHIHIIEAAPTSLNSISYARQRFSTISKLCNRKCLISYIKILEDEVRRSCAKSEYINIDVVNDDSEWFPNLELEVESDYFSLADSMKAEIESLPNRVQRRAAKKKYFDKNGKIYKKELIELSKNCPNSIKEITDKYPLTSYEVDLCIKAISTNTINTELKKVIGRLFADVDRLGDMYEKQWDRVLPISSYLRNIGNDLKLSIEDLVEKYKAIDGHYLDLKYDEINIKREQKELFDNLLITLPSGVAKSIASTLNLDASDVSVSWEKTPALLTATTLSCHLARKIVFSSNKIRPPKVSDFGDLSHTFYLPYVDVFRADGFIASTISESKLPFKTSVVGNINQLLDVINKRLGEP